MLNPIEKFKVAILHMKRPQIDCNIACGNCAHRIPEHCTCRPFKVTKGMYPDVDPYDVIIPIT